MSYADDSYDIDAAAPEGGDERAIAIVGMAGRFPGAGDLDAFWRNLRDGVEGIEELSDEALRAAGVDARRLEDPSYVKKASRLADVDAFDAGLFGFTAREAEILDPQQRVFLEQCWHALEDAGIDPARSEDLIGVYAGVAWNTYLLSNLVNHRELFDGAGGFQVFITNDKDFMPTRVAYKLDLKGPAVLVQSSCSTSLVATHLASLALQSFECDVALAGGVTVRVPQDEGYLHLDGGLGSPDGHCRSFDARAAGTIFGSGVGVVVLKRLEDALEDGDAIHAVIRGSAINNDGSLKVSYTAPSVEGQVRAIADAQAVAGVAARSIQYVEAHGTATSLGDPIEVTALTKVFRESTDDRGFCALGSVKSNVGHLDAAAGVAGLIKTTLALEHREIPPSLHFETPNPAIDFESSPFFVNDELRPWPEGDGAPRRAGVSSFGVGGTNAHAVLEEAPEPEPADPPAREGALMVLSAATDEALETLRERLAERFEQSPETSPADAAWTLQTGRTVLSRRAAAVVLAGEEPAAVLRDPARWTHGADDEAPRRRPLAFLFSGQGSQHLDMGRELYRDEPVFRAAFDAAAAALAPHLDVDLERVVYPPAGACDADRESAREELYRTRSTQPALFAVEHALARLWRSWGFEPAALAGHSIGIYAAAVEAEIFTLAGAARLVAARGRLMDELPTGAMAAVPLAERELAERLPPELDLAAVNETERCVVSGPSEAVERFVEELRADGVGCRELHTSHAFHSAMMQPAVEAFEAEVRAVGPEAPKIPIVSDATGTWLSDDEAKDPAYWARHLRRPVRFAAALDTLLAEEERALLEIGPGQTLATLARRHPRRRAEQPVTATLPAVRQADGEGADTRALLEALGRLWVGGQLVDWRAVHGEERRRKLRLPLYPFARTRFWIDAGAPPARRPSAGKREELASWFYLPAWRPAPAGAERRSPEGPWLVIEDEGGVAAQAAAALAERGAPVVALRFDRDVAAGEALAEGDEGYRLDPGSAAAWRALAAALAERELLPRAILYAPLAGAAAASGSRSERFTAAQRDGFFPLLELLRAFASRLGAEASAVDLWVATAGALAIGPGEAPRPERAPLHGLLRVLPQEHPGLRCRVVDLDPQDSPPEAAAALAGELLAADSDDERVALRGGRRWRPVFEPLPLAATGDGPLRRGGVYLLTGGLQGNGYALARALGERLDARLALLEPRTPEPGGDAAERLAELAELAGGAEVFVAELDDPAAVSAAAAAAAERWQGLDGIVHAAGTDGERTFRALRETGEEEAGWHFGPRAQGALALAAAVDLLAAEHQPRFVLLLSSLASELGGLAYGAYAAANAFLDAFAAERAACGDDRWLALGWDVWELEREARQITALRPELAALAMSPDEGWEAFRRALAGRAGEPRVLVSTGDLEARLGERRRHLEALRGEAAEPVAARPRHARPDLATPFAAPESELEQQVAAVWQELLGYEPIGLDDNFFELGGDSFVAIRVADRLQSATGVELPVARLYEGLTVRALAALLAEDGEQAKRERAEELEQRRAGADRRKAFLERRRGRLRGAD